MRVPLKVMERYCQPLLSTDELVDRLVMTGTEVEAVHQVGPPSTENFVVGHVLEAEKHPDADRLRVCRVDTGDAEPRTIVCGAPNVAAGQVVAVALPGAVMPGGMKIKRSKLRGVVSEGMICSEAELGISPESDGIMVLAEAEELKDPGLFPDHYRPGRPLDELFVFTDTVLELEVTPNRSDCFGIFGLAREVSAITGFDLQQGLPWDEDASETPGEPVDALASVTVEVPELCPRFTARVFSEVEVGPSPLWLKRALTAMGQRPINNVVDITNYVMLVTGQPLHAFDLDLVPDGALTIRRAREGEKLTTLDGVERELDGEMVVVADHEGAAAIAGIMGGAKSEVGESTTRVLLEVANWDGPNILGSSRRLALRSEASSRFERQLHPALCDRAQAMASRMLVDLCGAKMAPGTIDVAAAMPAPQKIPLVFADVERLLGIEVSSDEALLALNRLGFEIEYTLHELGPDAEVPRQYPEISVIVPPERHFDVTRPADLTEEIGRLHGYEKLPSTLPKMAAAGGLSREQSLLRLAQDTLRYQGFDEIVGWSFTDPGEVQRLRLAAAEPVRLSNPLSEDQSVMRQTLLGSLLNAAAYNLARGTERIALFESGRVYLQDEARTEGGALAGNFPGKRPAAVCEPQRLAALSVGPLRPGAWDGSPASGGFYALKGAVEALAGRLGVELEFAVIAAPEAGGPVYLHPGRAATVSLAGGEADTPIGWLGELHPSVAAEWDLADVTAFELDLAPLVAAATVGEEIFSDVTSFPAVRQDLAVVVPESTAAGEVEACVLEAGGELLSRAEVFDLFRGEQIGEDRKSLALRLEFRADDRTLIEEEVATLRGAIETAVAEIGGSIRE